MPANQTLLGYVAQVFGESGGVGLIVAFVFFVCLGIGLERALFWVRFRGLGRLLGLVGSDKGGRVLGRVEALVCRGSLRKAAARARESRDPALRLAGKALAQLEEPSAWASTRDAVLVGELGGNVTLGRRFLITAIQGFGLLGMLGTCKGLYAQLSSFGAAASEASSLQGAMGGMGEAFTTTLVGLTAAALTTLIYVPNEMAIEAFRRRLRLVDSRIQAALAGSESRRRSRNQSGKEAA